MLLASILFALPVQGDLELRAPIIVMGSGTEPALAYFEVFQTGLQTFVILNSTTSGPTPLALVDPLDGRILEVGLPLPGATLVGSNAAPGLDFGFVLLPFTGSPALQGLALYSQALSFPGTTTIFDQVSNPTTSQLVASETAIPSLVQLPPGLRGHRLVDLDDGGLILLGGQALDPAGQPVTLDQLYRFDNLTGDFELLPFTLQVARSEPEVMRLFEDRIVVTGGVDSAGNVLRSVELVDLVAQTSVQLVPMSVPRVGHTLSSYSVNEVVAIGGFTLYDRADRTATLASMAASIDRLSTTGGPLIPGPALPLPRARHTIRLTISGATLISGGLELDPSGQARFTADCRQLIPFAQALLPAAPMPFPRAMHGRGSWFEPGYNSPNYVGGVGGPTIGPNMVAHTDWFSYNALNDTWSVLGTAMLPRAGGRHLQLYPSQIGPLETYLIGGSSSVDPIFLDGVAQLGVQRFVGGSAGWQPAGTLIRSRPGAEAAPTLGLGRAIVVGGSLDATGALIDSTTAEVYAP